MRFHDYTLKFISLWHLILIVYFDKQILLFIISVDKKNYWRATLDTKYWVYVMQPAIGYMNPKLQCADLDTNFSQSLGFWASWLVWAGCASGQVQMWVTCILCTPSWGSHRINMEPPRCCRIIHNYYYHWLYHIHSIFHDYLTLPW